MEKQAAYLRVYEAVRHDIVSGVFPFGARIPSKRVMADAYSVSVITAEHALQLLEEEGYIEKRERSGSYVCYRSEDLISASRPSQHLHEALIPADDQFPYSVYAKAVRKVLNDYGEGVLQKTDENGSAILREAVASYLHRCRGISVDPENIIIGAGAEYLYSLCVQLLGRWRIFAIESPSYEKIRLIYRSSGVRLDPLKMGENGILSSELERTPASVLHVTPYASFPSGRSADASKRTEYLRWAEERNALIIEDDYASEFAAGLKNEKTLFAAEPREHVIYLNTFTKTIAPSARIGYLILPEKKAEMMRQKIRGRSCTVSTLTQLVLAELLMSGAFERHINRVRRKMRKTNNIRK